jgi:hypothetical protein
MSGRKHDRQEALPEKLNGLHHTRFPALGNLCAASAASFRDLGEWLPQGPLRVPHLNPSDRMNLPGTHAPFPYIWHMREVVQESAREPQGHLTFTQI